ncbi:RC-LH1 core complex protein PufX [Roseisalinus antarcticus]|uniref:Intrinsic membrane protein PufX n=1 Tax=Roseisalinus antarcticus TaxID=254357 RepID=A0A1Y5S3F3_9RHOB|nr:RC-LH1 core complex protein PufX [Roseisalinus antarcticus]SLN31845.1 Intrinsic membrane protein PufX [Roseisalinus antarcticus]
MSNNDDMLELGRKGQLSANVTYLMLKGAGYALAFVLAIWLVIAVIAFIGRQLPEDSRFTPDPTPTSFLVIEDVPFA